MKKLLIATTLLTLSTTAFSATDGTLLLKGTVGRILAIAVTAQSPSTTLDLAVDQTDLKVATVNEQSNVVAGYTVNISSAKLGNLERVGGAQVFPYSMKYDGASVALGTAGGQTFTRASTAAGVNVNKDVQISYTGVPAVSMIEGEYADTVTFTITAVN